MNFVQFGDARASMTIQFLSTFQLVKNAYLLIYNCRLPTEKLWHV